MRRALTLLLLLAVAGGVAWTLWRWEDAGTKSTDPWRAIPAEAALIIEVPEALAHWDRFTHTSQLARGWEQQSRTKKLWRNLTGAARMLEQDAALRNAFGDPTVLVALVRSGQGASALFVGPTGGSVPTEKLGALFGLTEAKRAAFAEGRPVACDADSSWQGVTACTRQGLWLLSTSADLIDEAVLQLERGTPITSDASFARARSTLGSASDAHVLVHTERLSGLLSAIWEPARIERLGLPHSWLAFDLEARPDAMLLSGLFLPSSADPFVATMAQQGAGPWSIARLLPADAVQCETRFVGDPDAASAARVAMDERLRGTEMAAPWMRGTAGTARSLAPGRQWFIAETDDPERAAEELSSPCANRPCDTLNHRGARITRYPEAAPNELLLGRATTLPQQPWWAILGGSVVMSDDADAVRACIDVWNDGGSLAEAARAKDWFRRMSDEAAFSWWCDAGRGGDLFKQGLRAESDSAFSDWRTLLRQHGGLSLQLSPASNGMVHVALGVQHAPLDGTGTQMASDQRVLWEYPLNALVMRKPDLVINHTNQTREVLVQDTSHRIHLISATGKLLWSRQLDGPILGAAHQVDRFRNGKLQLLLNSARSLYLIDRNGKDLGGFPITFPAPAKAPLSVFDYDNTREYRVLVPLADGRIHNWGVDGAPVQGWERPAPGGRVNTAVEHLRIRGKDHLLVVTDEGLVKLYDRRGASREAVKARLEANSVLRRVIPHADLSSTRLVWADAQGALYECTLGGQQRQLSAEGPAWVVDLGLDGTMDVVLLRGDSLLARKEGQLLFNRAFGTPLKPDLEPLELGRVRSALALVLSGTDRVTVVGSDGKELHGFPVEGIALPAVGDLNRDRANELITTTRDGRVVAYRLPSD